MNHCKCTQLNTGCFFPKAGPEWLELVHPQRMDANNNHCLWTALWAGVTHKHDGAWFYRGVMKPQHSLKQISCKQLPIPVASLDFLQKPHSHRPLKISLPGIQRQKTRSNPHVLYFSFPSSSVHYLSVFHLPSRSAITLRGPYLRRLLCSRYCLSNFPVEAFELPSACLANCNKNFFLNWEWFIVQCPSAESSA